MRVGHRSDACGVLLVLHSWLGGDPIYDGHRGGDDSIGVRRSPYVRGRGHALGADDRVLAPSVWPLGLEAESASVLGATWTTQQTRDRRRLTTGCRRRWAGWEVLGRRVGHSPTA